MGVLSASLHLNIFATGGTSRQCHEMQVIECVFLFNLQHCFCLKLKRGVRQNSLEYFIGILKNIQLKDTHFLLLLKVISAGKKKRSYIQIMQHDGGRERRDGPVGVG